MKTVAKGHVISILRNILIFSILWLSLPRAYAQPANDNCTGAIPLPVTSTCSYSTYTLVGATASTTPSTPPAPGCANYGGGDVWFTVTVPASGLLVIDTDDLGVTDGGMALYSGTCNALTLIDCNDDDSDNGAMPKIKNYTLTPGATLYVRFWEYGNDNLGTFGICAFEPPPPPANALCGGADPFCTGTTYNFPAGVDAGTGEPGPNYGCLSSTPNPVWYYLKVATNGPIEIYMYGSAGEDIDFACWGPFTDPTTPCTALLTSAQTTSHPTSGATTLYPSLNMIDCSYDAQEEEWCYIPNAVVGQYYLLLITNFSNDVQNIVFSQSGGTGTTDCSIIAPPITNNGPLCVGETLQLNVTSPTAGATYAWTGPNGFTSSTMNPSIPNVTATTAGTYSLTIQVGTEISSPVTTTVVVNPNPTVTALASPSGICLGSSTNLTASSTVSGTTYAWSNAMTGTPIIVSPSVNTTYTVTGTASGCTGTATATVSINPAPTPTAGNNSPLCATSTLNLTSGGGTSYAWTGPGGFTSNLQNPVIANAPTTASGTYTVTVTGSNGCTASTTTIVTINTEANPTASSNTPVCEGGSLNLTVNQTAQVYNWTGPNGFTSAVQNPVINPVTPAATGIYTVTITQNGGCTGSTTTEVSVPAMPVASTPTSLQICYGTAVPAINLNGTPSGVALNWSNSNPNIGLGVSGTGTIPAFTATNNGSTPATATITITPTANGCTGAAVSFDITVNPPPAISFPALSALCADASPLQLNSVTPTGGSFTGNGVNGTTFDPAVSGVGTFQITYTLADALGCTNTATQSITVHAMPTVNINPQDASICSGDPISLTASGATSYVWSGGSGLNQTTGANVTANPQSTATYQVTGTSNGCTGSASTTVTINALPAIGFLASPLEGCEPHEVNFSFSPTSDFLPASWSWNFGYGSASSTNENTSYLYTEHGIYVATLTALSADGCPVSATTTIQVWPMPVAEFSAHPDVVTTTDPTVHFTDLTTNANSWRWDFGDPASGNFNLSDMQYPMHDYLQAGNYNVTLNVTNEHGCSDTVVHNIVVHNPFVFWVPNAFSPNGDQVNDYFGPQGEGVLEDSYLMRVFDRWGRQIYFTTDINAPWDGRDASGKVQPEGIYCYQIYITDENLFTHDLIGSFTLVR